MPRGGVKLLFNLGDRRRSVFNPTPQHLYPRQNEDTGAHCTGGWVGPRAGLDGCRKSRPPLEFDPRTVQPVASRYTNWGIAVHSIVQHESLKQTTTTSLEISFFQEILVWSLPLARMQHVTVSQA